MDRPMATHLANAGLTLFDIDEKAIPQTTSQYTSHLIFAPSQMVCGAALSASMANPAADL